MKTPHALYLNLCICICISVFLFSCKDKTVDNKNPNIVIVFLDDSGWADFRPFEQTPYPTPEVQKLADEGCMFMNFHVPQAICSASRAALLSGCYPGRTKVFGAHGPNAKGLDPKFATMGEVFQKNGYATAIFGKWHIGDQPETRPWNRGFDETCGLMYSNDMWKHHPGDPEFWGQYPLRFWENDSMAIQDVEPKDQKNLTKWYTQHAVDFIHRHKDKPFFLYVPHNMPHVPLYCSDEFLGKSGKGLYADVMMEIDWSIGQINEALKKNGVDKNTIFILTSDNGPWVSYGNHAGKTPYRAAKSTSFDGGTRSACIIKYPEHIKPGTKSAEMFCSIDFMPSLCELTGTQLPAYEIDGENVWDIITGKQGAVNPHQYYAFTTSKYFESVMSGDGKWKLHLPHKYKKLETPGKDGMPGKYSRDSIELSLFNMDEDPYEKVNVIEKYPDVAKTMLEYANSHKDKFFKE